MEPELLLDAQAALGESPSWNAQNQTLYWVNIHAGQVNVFQPSSGQNRMIQLDRKVGCVAPRRSGGVVLGLQHSIATLDLDTETVEIIADLERHLAGNRFNDGKCDPAGRFLAGTMDDQEQSASGSLYSIDAVGNHKRLLTGLRISNGLGWSPDHTTLYFIDTPTRQMMSYAYDLETGELSKPRVVIEFPREEGFPDGMTTDQRGMVWVAMWGGARVSRWDPRSGQKLLSIPIPALNVTSCTFGGPDLTALYVTTARTGLSPEDIKRYPASGGLFCIQTTTLGMPTYQFGG